jgi:thiamine biosynthesis lipoprotein
MTNKIRYIIIFALLFFVTLFICQYRYIQFSGHTMGTTYHITTKVPRWRFQFLVKKQVDRQLAQLNQLMSTYRENSEISRFNRHDRSAFDISSDFYAVLERSRSIYSDSQGAWDPTVYPLFEIWQNFLMVQTAEPPLLPHIQERLSRVGFKNLLLLPDNRIQKSILSLQLDVSSIAKGYGVDKITLLFDVLGASDYLVEIGGEVAVKGVNPRGEEWTLGIEKPTYDGIRNVFGRIVLSSGMTMASSGNYRKYRVVNGKLYSHIIDPRTGYPVDHSVVGVTVISPECALSDALATALMVLGVDDGLLLLEKYPLAEALFFVRSKSGEIIIRQTVGFPSYH